MCGTIEAEEYEVRPKDGSITRDAELDYGLDDADPVAAQSITDSGSWIYIITPEFVPPYSMQFGLLTGPKPAGTGDYVDVWRCPDTLIPDILMDGPLKVQVGCMLVITSAAPYAIAVEGNLVAGTGGEGEGGPKRHAEKIVLVKLEIYDAFDGDGVGAAKRDDDVPVKPEKMIKRGAYGVTNLNDTDSDTRIDNTETGADANQQIANEKDMIKVVISKVENSTITGPFTVSITGLGTKVKLWKAESKAGGTASVTIATLPATFWVEGLQKSSAIRDITIKIMKGANVLGESRLTFVWAEFEQDANYFESRTMKLPALKALPPWVNITTPPCGAPSLEIGGIGLCRSYGVQNMADDWFLFLQNGMVAKFKVYPPVKSMWEKDGVVFDVTRQIIIWVGKWEGAEPWTVLDQTAQYPANDETPNDDDNDADESVRPKQSEMFVADTPGGSYAYSLDTGLDGSWSHYVHRMEAREFIRVRFDSNRPIGNVPNGARCSGKMPWFSWAYWKTMMDGQKRIAVRDNPPAPARAYNEIGLGTRTPVAPPNP